MYMHVTFLINQRLNAMDLYQIATAFWDQAYESSNSTYSEPYSPQPDGPGPYSPDETPAYDPRPEVPVPDVPEETPPYEREPETPPFQPEPGIPPVEPVVPEVEPLREPGEEPEIPAFM